MHLRFRDRYLRKWLHLMHRWYKSKFRLPFLFSFHREEELQSALFPISYGDVAVVEEHSVAHDGQSKPCASIVAGASFAHAIKTLE